MNDSQALRPPLHRNIMAVVWPWLMILAVVVFTGLIRGRLLDLPLERDEGEYAYAGQLILEGVPPFQLAYNMKLPGTYYAYAAGMRLFGQSAAGIHWTLIVVSSLTTVFLFLLGRRLLGVTSGKIGAVTCGLLLVSPTVLGLSAHANHFVILFAVPAAWVLWHAVGNGRNRWFFLSGLLTGIALLMKQQALFIILFGALVVLWNGWRQKLSIRRMMTNGFWFGGGAVLPFALLCVYLWLAGVFPKFWFWTFTYASRYATATSLADGMANLAAFLVAPSHWYVSLGFLGLAVAGLFLALRREDMRQPLEFLALFGLCSFLATATGLYFRPHYFILLLPAFSLLVGLGVQLWKEQLRSLRPDGMLWLIPPVGFALIVAGNICGQRNYFFKLSPDEVSRRSYEGEYFPEIFTVAGYVRDHSQPEDFIAVVGSEPQIYFYAHRRSATGFLYTYALMEAHPYARVMQKDLAREIEAAQPEYVVDIGYNNSWIVGRQSELGVFRWFNGFTAEHYNRVGLVELGQGPARYYWGEEAAQLPEKLGDYIAIYRRKGG